ncbi:MAG: UDP-N-acetylmuramoyl-tripeptide--D-alanyl-D-alanine ligase, partial [Limisphaerales bacterium]
MEPRTLKFVADACGGELKKGASETLVSNICTDSRLAKKDDLFVALAGENFDAHDFLSDVAEKNVAAVIAEQNKLPSNFLGCAIIAVENTRRALAQLASHYRADFDLPIIAVGGSNGKTSTKELIAAVLRQKFFTLWSEASFNNEIGVPLTLLRLEKNHQAAVLETGTNHPGELASLLRIIRPGYRVVTSIGREHLEFFCDMAGVVEEESSLARLLPANGTLFVNCESEWMKQIAQQTRAKVVRVGFNEKSDFVARNVRLDETGVTFLVTAPRENLNGDYRINLLGRHQVLN